MFVDVTAGHKMLSFMDTFSGYNQILRHSDDQDKTTSITERRIIFYKIMTFGLKNVGASTSSATLSKFTVTTCLSNFSMLINI